MTLSSTRMAYMNRMMDRRQFLGQCTAMGVASQALKPLSAAPARRLKIGHTGITWRGPEEAIPDIAKLGYYGYETFGDVLESWEAKGGLKDLLATNSLPFISAYCGVNLTDPSQRKAEIEKLVKWAKIIKS